MPREDFYSVSERRMGAARFVFDGRVLARLFGIDGAWCRDCRIVDISDSGARLNVECSVDGLNVQEFFLVLSTRGTAHRRCKLAWFRDNEIGVTFTSRPATSRSRRAR